METFIELVLRHLGTSAIMDLTCNLISGIEAPEYRQNALNVSRPVGWPGCCLRAVTGEVGAEWDGRLVRASPAQHCASRSVIQVIRPVS